ncbi:hypothetical protein B296_00002223 [Ensete ventricosum]|uniref:Uncharacterized protein n=1 Tax=Ensete ventricosum TaxID=4639 RepID=A0A427AXC3_ENSVE|nr:hypothetical protein B296_00002223 [Ensete ventricosum]
MILPSWRQLAIASVPYVTHRAHAKQQIILWSPGIIRDDAPSRDYTRWRPLLRLYKTASHPQAAQKSRMTPHNGLRHPEHTGTSSGEEKRLTSAHVETVCQTMLQPDKVPTTLTTHMDDLTHQIESSRVDI